MEGHASSSHQANDFDAASWKSGARYGSSQFRGDTASCPLLVASTALAVLARLVVSEPQRQSRPCHPRPIRTARNLGRRVRIDDLCSD